jgi:hypothetical protein
MARQAAELTKSKTRRGKTLASKGKKKGGPGSSSAPSSEVPPASRAEVPARSPPAEDQGLETELTPAPSRKRAAPSQRTSDATKKGKSVVSEEGAVWRPDWILKENSAALGNERLSAEYLCHSILPHDAAKVATKEDFVLLKDTATNFTRYDSGQCRLTCDIIVEAVF